MKIKNKFTFCFYIWILAVLLASCSNLGLQVTNVHKVSENEDAENCLQPIFGHFSYPIDADDKTVKHPGLDMFVLPPSQWTVEAPLPKIDGLTNWEYRTVNPIQTRRIDNHFEIWVYISRGAEEQSYLAIYRTDTKEWKVISERINALVLDKKGNLWGSYTGSISTDNRGISRFDELTCLNFYTQLE